MRQKPSNYPFVFVFIGIILLCSLCIGSVQKIDDQAIKDWAKKNEYSIKSVERCFVDRGPYWYIGKGERVYKVDLEDDRTFYFKFAAFQTYIEEYPVDKTQL